MTVGTAEAEAAEGMAADLGVVGVEAGDALLGY